MLCLANILGLVLLQEFIFKIGSTFLAKCRWLDLRFLLSIYRRQESFHFSHFESTFLLSRVYSAVRSDNMAVACSGDADVVGGFSSHSLVHNSMWLAETLWLLHLSVPLWHK